MHSVPSKQKVLLPDECVGEGVVCGKVVVRKNASCALLPGKSQK